VRRLGAASRLLLLFGPQDAIESGFRSDIAALVCETGTIWLAAGSRTPGCCRCPTRPGVPPPTACCAVPVEELQGVDPAVCRPWLADAGRCARRSRVLHWPSRWMLRRASPPALRPQSCLLMGDWAISRPRGAPGCACSARPRPPPPRPSARAAVERGLTNRRTAPQARHR
jgi:hypothetical protein